VHGYSRTTSPSRSNAAIPASYTAGNACGPPQEVDTTATLSPGFSRAGRASMFDILARTRLGSAGDVRSAEVSRPDGLGHVGVAEVAVPKPGLGGEVAGAKVAGWM
jgi:hypothetical protein